MTSLVLIQVIRCESTVGENVELQRFTQQVGNDTDRCLLVARNTQKRASTLSKCTGLKRIIRRVKATH